jgi:hypothetical protein
MANTIKLKRSATPAAVPTTGQLQLGELAINTYDGKIFLKKDDGAESIVQLGAQGDPGSLWRAGAGVPSDSLGVDGDLYLDTATANLYEKIAGVYVLVGNLNGTDGTGGSSAGTYLVSGATISWETGYTYRVGAATYYLNGVLVSSVEQTVTLAAADPALDRIDVLVLNSSGTLSYVQGTASASPAEPTVDPSLYLKLSIIFVTANTAAPDVTQTNIYAENAEWTATASAGTIVVNGTTNPRNGTYVIDGTNVAANTNVQFVKPAAGTTDLATQDTLTLFVRVKSAWPSNKSLRLEWYNGGTLRGSQVTVGNGAYGFNSALTGAYQQIVVPVSTFLVPPGSLVTTLRITVVGGGANIGFYVDDIFLQAGTPAQVTQNWRWRGTWSSAVIYNVNDVVYYNNSSYICLVQNQNKIPSSNPTEWGLIAQGQTVGGADTQVQFNDGGVLGGDDSFVWNKTTNILTLGAASHARFGSGSGYFSTS